MRSDHNMRNKWITWSGAPDTARVFAICFLMSTSSHPWAFFGVHIHIILWGNVSLKQWRCSPQLPSYLALTRALETPLCTEQGHPDRALLAHCSFKGSFSLPIRFIPPCAHCSRKATSLCAKHLVPCYAQRPVTACWMKERARQGPDSFSAIPYHQLLQRWAWAGCSQEHVYVSATRMAELSFSSELGRVHCMLSLSPPQRHQKEWRGRSSGSFVS